MLLKADAPRTLSFRGVFDMIVLAAALLRLCFKMLDSILYIALPVSAFMRAAADSRRSYP